MKISRLLIFVFLIAPYFLLAQTKEILFSIDNHPYYTDEFIRVYNKNLDLVKDDSQKDLEKYLDLFVGYKLKVEKANKLGLQNGTNYQNELKSYRNQLSKNYLNDSKVTNELVREAYDRMQQEVRASHILVLVDEGASAEDTLKAYNKIIDIKRRLDAGEDFVKVAQQFSEDPSVKENNGDLGYFSAFRMVYPFENAAYKIEGETTYAIQFHPEVYHSTDGKQMLENFLVKIAQVPQNFTPNAFVEEVVAEMKAKIGNDKVVLGLSGGVDSTVAAVLLNKAIGENLYCIFVNNGLLRKNEFQNVLNQYKGMGLNVKGVDASARFLDALAGLDDPEAKRKAIGKAFIEVFDDEAHQLTDVKWLGQGTIYPDVIESVSATGGPSATIKSHHNVGGLPDFMKLQVVEPLRMLFKDEVRRVGRSLGIDEELLGRHPFPGPGLAIRILGDITAEKVAILQEVDAVFINGLKEHGLYDKVWQAGAILLPVNSVGVMGDEGRCRRSSTARSPGGCCAACPARPEATAPSS